MHSNMPEISVVIPTYNYARFLKKCLESLVSQSFVNWEAIVVNNFSDDNTAEVVEGFSDRRIRLVNFRNNGVIAASRNKGIELSRANLIAFLDSDDSWYPEKLEKCVKELNSGADLVCHGMRYIVNGSPWKDVTYNAKARSDFLSLLYGSTRIFTSSVVVRKECLLRVSGFDENPGIITAEDRDLWLRLSKEGCRFCFIKDILGEYNCHEDSLSRQAPLHLQAGLNVINKYASGNGERPLSVLKIRKARALFFYGFGRNFQRKGRRLAALRFFLRSLVAYPFLLSPYAGLLLVLLPTGFSNLATRDLSPAKWKQGD